MFAAEEVERARRYQRPMELGVLSDQTVALALVLVLAFGPPGGWLAGIRDGGHWWIASLLIPLAALGLVAAASLPFAVWSRGHERRWGFERRSARAWVLDQLKGLLLGLVFGVLPPAGLVASARLLPRFWPLLAASTGALLVLASFALGPLLVEPLFSRFRPLTDEALAERLRALAERAGVPVRGFLVAHAGRRTRKLNAYVSGLGRTRRLVLYDTLLAEAEPAEVELVVAHELGHRRRRHVLRLMLLAMAGAALAIALYALAVSSDGIRDAAAIKGAADPRATLLVLAVLALLRTASTPAVAALSRRFERQADRDSIRLTGSVELFERTMRRLALANLADLAPPRLLYLLLFSHPTPPERIAAARALEGASHAQRPAPVAG
ncbi:MAG: M48 family metalloprotease [Gaiellaceae bacterium]